MTREASYIGLIREADAWYECPKSPEGKRLGPLVGYAGRYDGEHQYVGDAYINFAKVEQQSRLRGYFSRALSVAIFEQFGRIDYVIGPEWGGVLLATDIAKELDCDPVVAQKQVIAPVIAGNRPQTRLILDRHIIKPGSRGVCIEDICNNFSTTKQVLELVEEYGTTLLCIACAFNRSAGTNWESSRSVLPVISAIHYHLPEYRQDDPEVVGDIRAGNWRPKPKEPAVWRELMDAMNRGSSLG